MRCLSSLIAASSDLRDLSLPISNPTIVFGKNVCPLSGMNGTLTIILPPYVPIPQDGIKH